MRRPNFFVALALNSLNSLTSLSDNLELSLLFYLSTLLFRVVDIARRAVAVAADVGAVGARVFA